MNQDNDGGLRWYAEVGQYERQIKTELKYPPIPVRNLDWVAYRDGDEGESQAPHGYGATEQEAIQDLMEQEQMQ